jgi:hypothetical protein
VVPLEVIDERECEEEMEKKAFSVATMPVNNNPEGSRNSVTRDACLFGAITRKLCEHVSSVCL